MSENYLSEEKWNAVPISEHSFQYLHKHVQELQCGILRLQSSGKWGWSDQIRRRQVREDCGSKAKQIRIFWEISSEHFMENLALWR